MEHRYYHRSPSDFYVELWCGDNHLGRCRVRNIAPDGMFIENGMFIKTGAAELREYDLVRVVVPSGSGGYMGRVVIGVLCYASTDGIGIMLSTEALRNVA